MNEDKLFEIVRNAYNGVNTDYLKSQVLAAVAEIGLTRQEVMDGLLDWIVVGGCTGVNDRYRRYIYGALALLREQEARVLTFKEVETSKGFVWVEFNSTNENRLSLEYVNVRAIEGFRDSFALTTDSGIKWFRDRGDYNRGIWFGMNSGWRCWTSRPSEQQMRNTKWEEN